MKKCILLLFFLVCQTKFLWAQDNFPIRANATIMSTQNWSELYSSDYFVRCNLLLKDNTKTNLPVFLKIKLERVGLIIQTKPDYVAPQPIYLNFGEPISLSGFDLREYFNPNNLIIEGMDESFLRNGGHLPDGFYIFSITAYEFDPSHGHRQVSNVGVGQMNIFLGLPPQIIFPNEGAVFPDNYPQSILFQWMPRATATQGGIGGMVYQFKIYEVDENEDPAEVVQGKQAILTETTSIPSLFYDLSKPALLSGHRYVIQVQVQSADGSTKFQNDGYSQIVSFYYGKPCTAPENLSITTPYSNLDRISWTAVDGADSYDVSYKTAIGSWHTFTSYQPNADINDFENYTNFKLQANCSNSRKSNWTEGTIPPISNAKLSTTASTTGPKLMMAAANPSTDITGQSTVSANPFDAIVSSQTIDDASINAKLQELNSTPTTIQNPCGTAVRNSTDCNDTPIIIKPGTEIFMAGLNTDIFINGYAIKVTSGSNANGEGLLYLPNFKIRIPVEWKAPLIIKKGLDNANYGCVESGTVKAQGSVDGVLSSDLLRQVTQLLTQPGNWTGKLSDSFQALADITREIAESPNEPTDEQISKLKAISTIAEKAVNTWSGSLDRLIASNPNNAASTSLLKDSVNKNVAAIKLIVAPKKPTKATITTAAALAAANLSLYNKAKAGSEVLRNILDAIKSSNSSNKNEVDITKIISSLSDINNSFPPDYITRASLDDFVIVGLKYPLILNGDPLLPSTYSYTERSSDSKVIININSLDYKPGATKIEGLGLTGSASDLQKIWDYLGIIRNGTLKLIDLEHTARFAKENETLYVVQDVAIARDVELSWDASLSDELNLKTITGPALKEGGSSANFKQYESASNINPSFDPAQKSLFSKGGKIVNLEIVKQQITDQTESNGTDTETWNAFNEMLDKINDALKTQKEVQLGTKSKPCESSAQICVEFDAAAGKETHAQYDEIDNEPYYKHVKKVGDYISMNVGISRDFVPSSAKFDLEFVSFVPALKVGLSGEGKFWSFKEYSKKLPMETQYTSEGKFINEASFGLNVAITGSISASVGLKGAFGVGGSGSISVNAKLAEISYDFTNNKPIGSFGPISVIPQGSCWYYLFGAKGTDTWKSPIVLIEEVVINKK